MPWKTLLIILVGAGAAYGSLTYQQQWTAEHQEKISVPVPAHKIETNHVIETGDLITKTVLKASLETNDVTAVDQIVGMAAKIELYPNELILREKLESATQVLKPGEVLVTVKAENLEEILGGRIRPNMLVDVLFTANVDAPPAILAERARVIATLTQDGKPVNSEITAKAAITNVTGNSTQPKLILLKVKRNESYNFTKPLNGGHVLITQVGEDTTNSNITSVPQPQSEPTTQAQVAPAPKVTVTPATNQQHSSN